jgi:hypothetical protein
VSAQLDAVFVLARTSAYSAYRSTTHLRPADDDGVLPPVALDPLVDVADRSNAASSTRSSRMPTSNGSMLKPAGADHRLARCSAKSGVNPALSRNCDASFGRCSQVA